MRHASMRHASTRDHETLTVPEFLAVLFSKSVA